MALTGWLDAFRTLYLRPGRVGNPIPMIYHDGKTPEYTAQARANLDAGECRHAIAQPAEWAEKNAAPDAYYGMCLLLKPGPRLTATNFAPSDYGLPIPTD